MNLNGLVRGLVGVVTPPILGTVFISTGYVTSDAGVRTPTYDQTDNVLMSVQALTAKEIDHLDSLNVQGVTRGVYINGAIDGVRRVKGKGGDLLGFLGSTWLVVQVLETWDTAGWCKVAVAEQVDAP